MNPDNVLIIYITSETTFYSYCSSKYSTSSIDIQNVPTYLTYKFNEYSIPAKDKFINYNEINLFDYNTFKKDLENINNNKTINMFCIFIKLLIEKCKREYLNFDIDNIAICLEYNIVKNYKELLVSVLNVFRENNLFTIEINKNNNLISNIYILNEYFGNNYKILMSLPQEFIEKYQNMINVNINSDSLEIFISKLDETKQKIILKDTILTNDISSIIYKNHIIKFLLVYIQEQLPDFHNIEIEKVYSRFIEYLCYDLKCDITLEIDNNNEVQIIDIDIDEVNQMLNNISKDLNDYIINVVNRFPKEKSLIFFTGKLFNIEIFRNKVIDNLNYKFINMNNKSQTAIEGYNLLIRRKKIDLSNMICDNYQNTEIIMQIKNEVLNIVNKITIMNKIKHICSRISNIINIMIKSEKYKDQVNKLKSELRTINKMKNHGEVSDNTLNYLLRKLYELEKY